MRKIVSVACAAALFASTTVALADGAQQSTQQPSSNSTEPLTPGGAAGVHYAEKKGLPPIFWIGVGVVAVGVGAALALSNTGGTHTTTGTTGR